MPEVYETLALGGEERNAESLGTFVAWLIANHLLEENFEARHGSAVARVRMQDLTGADFLTTVLHGDLKPLHVKQEARPFVESYLVTGKYLADYKLCEYPGENEWLRYDEVSPLITAAWRGTAVARPGLVAKTARILSFPGRKQ